MTLNDPEKRNTLSGQMLAELVDAMKRARDDEEVRAVVLTGAGDKVFCAGADLGGFAADVPLVAKHFATDLFLEFFRLMPRLGKPSLCAANGHVLAGGMGLALSCDLVIAKEGATFGTPEINVGAFPYMIMAIIYRNVPRKKVNEMMLLGERLTRRAGGRATGSPTRSSRRPSSTPRSPTGPAKLASKSPVLMRLGHDAMYRQQDMALDDALELPALAALAHLHDRGHRRGRHRLLREARAAVERAIDGDRGDRADEQPRTLAAAARRPAGRARPQQLHERREQGQARRRRGEDRQAARARQADRARADRPAGRRGHLRRDRHPRPARTSPSGRWTAVEAPADGVITGWGDVDGRACCIAAYDFTVMAGSMGMTGELKVTRLREMALQKRMPFIWLLDSAGARIQEAAGSLFAGSGHLFREEVEMSGVVPHGRGDDGPLRRRHRLHPGALGLRADGRPARARWRSPART